MRLIRLFFVGIFMGIADLIPGVSGGTIAFICGIYEDLLEGIKSLQCHSLKKIAWPFLLPLGMGIALSLICFSRPLYYLLLHYPLFVNAFFFGLIGGSAYFCFRKASLKGWVTYVALVMSFLISFIFSSFHADISLGPHFFTLFVAGAIASFAMLLPGISGSYLLHLLGLYPIILFSLGHPFAENSLSILFSLGLGCAFGLIVFSRLISWLLRLFYQMTLAILIGLMVGGMRSLWPFEEKVGILPIGFIACGFLITLLLEMWTKKSKRALKQSAE